MNILNLIFENLVSVFGFKIFKFFDADPDPVSGIQDLVNPGSGGYGIWDGKRWSRDKHPGPAALPPVHREKKLENKISI
jgi:hypothetical protein